MAIVARRPPYTVGPVLTGLALALSRLDVGLGPTRDVVIPPPLIPALSPRGVRLSAAAATAALGLLLHRPLSSAMTLGAHHRSPRGRA